MQATRATFLGLPRASTAATAGGKIWYSKSCRAGERSGQDLEYQVRRVGFSPPLTPRPVRWVKTHPTNYKLMHLELTTALQMDFSTTAST
jgi:hypothetical protein